MTARVDTAPRTMPHAPATTATVARRGIDRVLDLPPFWLTFAFIAFASLPQAFLALPIAAAPMGPLPSVALVVVIGALNVLGAAAMSEAIARLPVENRPRTVDGVVRAYLGPRVARIAALSMVTIFFVALIAASLAFASALGGFTNTPKLPWLILLAVVVLAITSRGTIGFSVAIVLGATSAVVLLAIVLAVLPDIRLGRLADIHLPFTGGQGLAPDLWSSILGVVFLTFFGQTLLPPAATFILPRDPSGRSFVRGSVLGMAFLVLLVIMWLLAVDTAVFPGSLIGLHGTILVTLGRDTSPLVTVLGTILVLVLPGLTAIRCAGMLSTQVKAVQASRSGRGGSVGAGSVGSAAAGASAVVAPSAVSRLVLPALPSVVGLLIVGGLIVAGTADLSSIIAIGGVLGASVTVGMVPPVIVFVARRRSSTRAVDGTVGLVGRRPIIALQFGVAATVVLAYGLVVWTDPVERIAALVVAVGSVAWLVWFARRGGAADG